VEAGAGTGPVDFVRTVAPGPAVVPGERDQGCLGTSGEQEAESRKAGRGEGGGWESVDFFARWDRTNIQGRSQLWS
jgi:hypothetical protein